MNPKLFLAIFSFKDELKYNVQYMRWRRRHLVLLLISIASFLALAALVVSFPPDQTAPFPTVPLFFVLLSLTISSAASFLLKNILFGLLVGTLITAFFLLRLFF